VIDIILNEHVKKSGNNNNEIFTKSSDSRSSNI